MQDLIQLIDETINNETERLWDELPAPDGLVNRITGLPPTEVEWTAIKARAQQILDSPYSAPELVAWAMDICPQGIIVPFEGAIYNKRRMRYESIS